MHTAQANPQLFTSYYVESIQLALAHADKDADQPKLAATACRDADATTIPRNELRRDLVGSRSILAARRELFCGDPAKGRALLQEEASNHPKHGEPHRILAEYDLATHQCEESAREFNLWMASPDVQAACSGTTH